MDNWNTYITNLIQRLGFEDYTFDFDGEHRHGAVFIHDNPTLIQEHLPLLVESVNHILQLVAKKHSEPPVILDINNYRREREGLIIELVRASARKVLVTKQEVSLPAMNSYERRLAHVELAANPNVITESVGVGRDRYVIIKPLKEEQSSPGETSRADITTQFPVESA